MTRRSVQSLDPELDRALATLPKEVQERLNLLRVRLLLAPGAKRWLGKDLDAVTEKSRKHYTNWKRRYVPRKAVNGESPSSL